MSRLNPLVVAFISLTIVATPTIAAAKGGRGGKATGISKSSMPHGWQRGKKMGWKGGSTPPGWTKGRKTGWKGEMLPPGLFKRR